MYQGTCQKSVVWIDLRQRSIPLPKKGVVLSRPRLLLLVLGLLALVPRLLVSWEILPPSWIPTDLSTPNPRCPLGVECLMNAGYEKHPGYVVARTLPLELLDLAAFAFFSFFIFGVLRLMISNIRSSLSVSSSMVSYAVLSGWLILGATSVVVRRALPENKDCQTSCDRRFSLCTFTAYRSGRN